VSEPTCPFVKVADPFVTIRKVIEQYEVESLVNVKSRDFNVDTKGNLLVVEEATTIDAIPATAEASILKKVADGKLRPSRRLPSLGNR
jgi:hypothetical protein